MTWVKLDDLLPEHAKIADLSADAFRSWVFVLCLCSRLLTDGQVSEGQLSSARVTKRARRELVGCGLWHEREGGGIVVHDYLKYQPSKADVETRRKATRERMNRHRAHSNTVSDAVTDSVIDKLVTPSVTGLPIPSRSRPVPEEQDPTHTAAPDPDTSSTRVAPAQQQPLVEIPCPRDLELTEDQTCNLEMSLGIPKPAITYLVRRFVTKSMADPTDKRTLVVWRKCASVAVAGGWNNAKIREEYLRQPAHGLLEHERRQAAPKPKAPRLHRQPEPEPLSLEEHEKMLENAMQATSRRA